MPEILIDRSYTATAREYGRIGRYSLAGAVVVYFSTIQQHVPLLAPLLLIIFAYSAYRMFGSVWPAQKSRIVSEWGEDIAVIPHHDAIGERRRTFEAALMDAVREARQRHYES